MNATERKRRDRMIIRLFQKKTPQVVIAAKVGLNAPRVHYILEAHGLLPPAKKVEHVTRTIWDTEDQNRLRRAIHKRQREGARAALAAMMGLEQQR